MTNFLIRDISKTWHALTWQQDNLMATQSQIQPLCAQNAPTKPGLYRFTWIGGWHELALIHKVRATKRIENPTVDLSGLTPPVCLSVGRTTNLRKRIRQHFGNNKNSNRLFQRLRQIVPLIWTDKDILASAVENLKVEWVEVPNWIERCLLESYGKAIECPIFDLDAEH
jgi:hypothetical protein